MFFHPRNKNLAIGSLIEALLYDAQRKLSTNFELLHLAGGGRRPLHHLPQVPARLPGGHRYRRGSVLEREILSGWGYKHTPIATKLTLSYLDSHSPAYNSLFRASVIQLGGTAQRVASKLLAPFQPADGPSDFYPLADAAFIAALPIPARRCGTRCRTASRTRRWSSSLCCPADAAEDRLLFSRLRLGAALLRHLHGHNSLAAGNGNARGAAAAVSLLRISCARECQDNPALAHCSSRFHPVHADSRDVRLSRFRRLRGHMRNLPGRPGRDGDSQALRPHCGCRRLPAGAWPQCPGGRKLPLSCALSRLARRQGRRHLEEDRRIRTRSPRWRIAAPKLEPFRSRVPALPTPCCTASANSSRRR